MTVLLQEIPQNLLKKRIILGHTDQVHFVSTEFNSPFPKNFVEDIRKGERKMKDVHQYMPFRWSTNIAGKLHIFFRKVSRSPLSRDVYVSKIYNLYKQKKAVEARLLWYKTHGGDIPNFEKDKVDLFASETKQFFEFIQ